MADGSTLATTIISTVGALLGALGGIGLTQGSTMRREARLAELQQDEQRRRSREEACVDLLGTARQLRLQIEVAARCPWRDMDDRLSAIERQAAEVNLHASRVTLLASREVADAARAVAEEARRLVSLVAGLTVMQYDEAGEFRGGEMRQPPGFADFDTCVQAFEAVGVATVNAAGRPDPSR